MQSQNDFMLIYPINFNITVFLLNFDFIIFFYSENPLNTVICFLKSYIIKKLFLNKNSTMMYNNITKGFKISLWLCSPWIKFPP